MDRWSRTTRRATPTGDATAVKLAYGGVRIDWASLDADVRAACIAKLRHITERSTMLFQNAPGAFPDEPQRIATIAASLAEVDGRTTASSDTANDAAPSGAPGQARRRRLRRLDA